MVQVEMAGPRQPPTVTLVPNDIKAMATRVLETCTKKTSYIGGFLTSDLGGMKQWLTSSEGDLDRPMRESSLPLLFLHLASNIQSLLPPATELQTK